MDRRRFIKGSMAMAAVCGTSGIASLFLRRHSRPILILPTGKPSVLTSPFYSQWRTTLAQTAWRGAPRPLPDTLATMTPQAYNSIQYDAEKSLWHNVENRQLDAQFSIWEWDSVAAFVCFL